MLDDIRQATMVLFTQRATPAPSPKPMLTVREVADDAEIYQGMPEHDLNFESPTKAFRRAVFGGLWLGQIKRLHCR